MKRRNATEEATKPRRGHRLPPDSIQAKIIRLSEEIPQSEWDRVPKDGSINLDHYLYGSPKK
jgi:hypothetical protein